MDMKISALLLLLLAATWTASQGASFRQHKSNNCCTEVSNTRIPHSKIKGYKDPDPNCTLRAALVQLQTDVWACVNPKAKWLQKYLRKQKKANSTSK